MITPLVNPERKTWEDICTRPAIKADELKPFIEELFSEVAKKGDEALLYYANKIDGYQGDTFALDAKAWEYMASACPSDLKQAIEAAARNIVKFHEDQPSLNYKSDIADGISCWQEERPIPSVALYIPGGSAPLFSTVLMLAIPAAIAKVPEINLFTPARKAQEIHPAIAFAAKLAGVKRIFTLGGAQAIAAASLGTQSIPKCFKIFGPGNQYVTAAKQYSQQVGTAIDMPAGPSEVLVWADASSNPAYAAADLLSQAEHGADSQCVLLCDSQDFAKRCLTELEGQLQQLSRKDVAEKSLANARFVVLEDLQAQKDFVNAYAPEHLVILSEQADALLDDIFNAGSVFVGPYSPESAGDYASGTNHTLPTAGFAKAFSGVSTLDFKKRITFQKLSKAGLENLATTITTMAEAEGLDAHANAVRIRS